MLISATYPSKYLTAGDLDGKSFTLTIHTVTLEEMVTHDNKKVQKPVCWFEKAQKGFVMNVTNARVIVALYGDETSEWSGKRITIYPTKVKAFGSFQDAIRVREEIPAAPKPPAQAAQVEETTGLDDDEDVADFEDEGNDGGPNSSGPDGNLWEPDTGPERATQDRLDHLDKLGKARYGAEWEAKLPKLVEAITTGATTVAAQLRPAECERLIKGIESLQAAAVQSTNGAKKPAKVTA